MQSEDNGSYLTKRVWRNSALRLVEIVVSKAATALVLYLMARAYGPAVFGTIALTFTLVYLGSVVTQFGSDSYGLRQIASGASRAEDLLPSMLGLQLSLCVPTIAAIWLFAAASTGTPAEWAFAALCGMTLLPNGLSRLVSTRFHADENFLPVSVLIVLAALVHLLSVTSALKCSATLPVIGVVMLSVAVARSLAAVALYGTRFGTLRLRFDPLEWLRTARRALPYFLIVVLAAIHMKVDILMLRSMIDSTAVGVYGVAAMIASLACVLIQALMRGLFPAVARASGANAELSAQRALNTLRFPAALGFGVAIGVFVLARPVIAAFFGDDYAGSADCLRILVWFLPSIFVSSTAIRIMAATGRAHWVHRILLVNCALNIAANLVLIPRAGILGASAATVFSSWASASQCIFLLVRRRVRGRPDSAPESRSEGEALDDTAF